MINRLLFDNGRWRALCFLGFFLLAGNLAAAGAAPRQVVEGFQELLLETMREGESLGYEGRYRKLEPVVKESHDLGRVARIVLGPYWKDLSEEQQKQFSDVFLRLSAATYAFNFKEYEGESFRFVSEEERGEGNHIVQSIFTTSDGEEIRFDYMLRKRGDRWLIVNIIAGGVSDLALKRSEYASIMRREGFPELLDRIESKIAEYAKKES